MTESLTAPVCHFHSLRILALHFHNQALAMKSFSVIWTLLQSPIIVDICVLYVSHIAVASAHIVTESCFEQFKVLKPHYMLLFCLFNITRIFHTSKVHFHRQLAIHCLKILIAENEAFLIGLNGWDEVSLLKQTSALVLYEICL